MTICAKCGKRKGKVEVEGKEYCNICFAEILKGREKKLKREAEAEILVRGDEEAKIKKLMSEMIITSTNSLENIKIEKYLGFISAEVVLGTGIISESLAGISDIFGKESKSFDKKINKSKELVIQKLKLRCIELGGNSIIGVKYDLETIGKNMIMAVVSGTAINVV